MTQVSGFDHVAFAVPDLKQQVERLTQALGMEVVKQTESYALVADSRSGFKIELTASQDEQAHFRHLGFLAQDVDSAHAGLVEAGMASNQEPHRRDFAGMRTSFLQENNGLEIQLVKYD